MKEIKTKFKRLEKKISGARWFSEDWEIYNRGPYLQLYKSNWFNGSQGGIHFETYIEGPQLKNKSFPVCLHAEEDCPSQSVFIEELLKLEGDRIRSWKGYTVVGQGYSICQKSLPLNFKNIEDKIFDELNRLRQLEESIEAVLSVLGTADQSS